MFWQEDNPKKPAYEVPDDVQDLVFGLRCRTLPLDHAHALSSALITALPWLSDEPRAGIHLIHVAESGNGWLRPENPENELLHLSRRTRMTLRLPRERLEDARALCGQTLDIAGHALEVRDAEPRLFTTQPVLFARHVLAERDEDEMAFLERMADEVRALDIQVRKMMAGKIHRMQFPEGEVLTRSLMLADLDVEESVRLQQHGVGGGRLHGCGLFLPHKGIKPVNPDDDNG